MRTSSFIAIFLFVCFGETLPTPKEIEARLQSLELANSKFEVEINTLELSNIELNQKVNLLKHQVAELLEKKLECEMDEANQTLKNVHGMVKYVQDQAECEYKPF